MKSKSAKLKMCYQFAFHAEIREINVEISIIFFESWIKLDNKLYFHLSIKPKMINLDNLDPDWDFASKHGKASLTGILPTDFEKSSVRSEICPCCYHFVYKDPVPVCANPKQLQFLGFGFPLFYIFMKNCMILLIISICSYNALSLKQAFTNNKEYCHPTDTNTTGHRRMLSSEGGCFSFMIEMSRIQSEVTPEQNILRVTSFIVQMLFLIYMQDHICKLDAYYDERDVCLSDFSIMLKKMPKQQHIQQKLRQFFINQFEQQHQIKSSLLIPQYHEIDSLKKERAIIVNRLRKAYKNDVFTDEDKRDQQNIIKIDEAIMEQIMASRDLAKRDKLECQKAILVFNTQQEREKIIKQFRAMQFSKKEPYFGVGSENITIKQAPQPKQIIWENVYVSRKSKLFLYILAWFLSIIVLGIVTLIAYYLYQYKAANLKQAILNYQLHPDDEKYQFRYRIAIAMVYGVLLVIILFNKLVMSVLYHKLTDIERHETRSKFEFFFGLRYALGLFFTTALMTLIVEALVLNNYNKHPYGVIEEQTLMFFLTAVLVPLYWFINPFNLAKKIKRHFKYGKRHLTQRQANQLMEQSQYDMGKRYAQTLQTMWFTFLYATLVPIGAFASLLGLGIFYWTDKYNLLRKSSVGGEVSGHVVLASMKLLDFTLLMRPIGQIIFDTQLRHGSGLYFNIGMIIVAVTYIILPTAKIIEFINPENFKMAEKTYEELKHTFKDTYHSQHPIYKIIHAQRLNKKILSKGLIIDLKSTIRSQLLQDFSMYDNQQISIQKPIASSSKTKQAINASL